MIYNSELPKGSEIIAEVRKRTDNTLVSFSRGKDSIATWLAVKDRFEEVAPYFYYVVPDLDFVNEDLYRWEKIFGRKILQLPAPGLYRMLAYGVYQPLNKMDFIDACELPQFGHDDLQKIACEHYGLNYETTYNALGVRAKDSVARRFEVLRSRGINEKRRIYYPCADMSKDDLIAQLRRYDIKLPIDYKYFGCSFDGIYARFLVPIKNHFPSDYKKILEVFPFAEAEAFRAERVWKS